MIPVPVDVDRGLAVDGYVRMEGYRGDVRDRLQVLRWALDALPTDETAAEEQEDETCPRCGVGSVVVVGPPPPPPPGGGGRPSGMPMMVGSLRSLLFATCTYGCQISVSPATFQLLGFDATRICHVCELQYGDGDGDGDVCVCCGMNVGRFSPGAGVLREPALPGVEGLVFGQD